MFKVRRSSPSGDVPEYSGVSWRYSGGVPGMFRACSWFYRHPPSTWLNLIASLILPRWGNIYRGYYTVARRYEFYVRVAWTISHQWAKRTSEILFLHENIKFISSSQRVMFFLLYGETNSTKAKGGNRDVIERYDTHKGDIRKIRHSGPGRSGVWNLRVV